MVYLITKEVTWAIVHRSTSFIHERAKNNGVHGFPKTKWLNF